MTMQALFSRKWSNDLLLCLFTSTKQAQQLRKQLKGISRERGVLLFSGKWNQQGQKKPPPLSNTSWGCIEGFQLTALACLCLIIVHSLIENLARTPHLKNNRPFFFKGSWSSSDLIASSSNSVWSKRGREEHPCWFWGSGGVNHMAVLSLVESHLLYVFIAWLGKEESNPLKKSFGALEPSFCLLHRVKLQCPPRQDKRLSLHIIN